MNGYLMQEQRWTSGQDLFIESFSPENRFGVVFEDDGETAYFYAVEKDNGGAGLRVLDALHIHETGNAPASGSSPNEADHKEADLKIIWSRDWLKCALVIDGYVHALFDFETRNGYNINEFPPPNEFWTQGDRKLTAELVARFF